MIWRTILSHQHDPFFNLAKESYLLKTLSPHENVLFFYRNFPCVVIGRGQNPWAECHLQYMQAKQISLVRRETGGGAVYHDLGNLNISFICSTPKLEKKTHLSWIQDTLAALDIPVHFSERGDIFYKEHKISGSAYRILKDRSLHHLTLLIKSDLVALNTALQPPCPQLLTSRGTHSVRSVVTNLSEPYPWITYELVVSQLTSTIQKNIEVTTFPEFQTSDIWTTAQEKQTWSWRFGKTLPFERIFKNDHLVITITVCNGRIFSILGDSLTIEEQQALLSQLIGCPYDENQCVKIIFEIIGQHVE